VPWAVLRAWYFDRLQTLSLWALEQESRMGHETIRKLILEEREARGELRPEERPKRPFNPRHRTVLDLEGYHWDVKEREAQAEQARQAAQTGQASVVETKASAPHLPSHVATLRAMLPARRDLAMKRLDELEELLRSAGHPPLSAHGLCEMLRRMYDEGEPPDTVYARQRKPKKPRE
jgi:hypothetical protein